MQKGGKTLKYSARTLVVLRLACLVMAFVLAAYDLAIFLGLSAHSPLYQPISALATVAGFIVLGILQYALKPHTRRSLTISLSSYYVMATLSTILVTGGESATYIFWLMILIGTSILFGVVATYIGITYFLVMMLALCLLDANNSIFFVNVMSASILTAGTAIFINMMKAANVVRFDLYEQAKTQEKIQRDRLLTVINTINEAIISIDPDGYIRLYNSTTLSLLDTNLDLDGKPIDEMLHLFDEDNKPVKLAELTHNLKTVLLRDDLSHQFDDGQKMRIDLTCSPVHDAYGKDDESHMNGVILIFRDITKAKSLDEERDEFISVVSHELRTPVAIAEGALSNIQFLIEKGGDVKMLEKTLGDAHQQILFLGQMVNDLSTLSRAQRGVNMEPEDIDIKDFLNELYNKYVEEAKKQQLELRLDAHATGVIRVPRMAIEEVMQNLITNAIKYTKEGSVTIGAHRVEGADAPTVELSVRDTGIGISKSDQAHVFQRFWRSEDYRTRETSGTGLGLHVVEQLAAKMNTQIELASRLNHGSTFSFRLPLLTESTAKNQVGDEADNQIM
jgi:signal transduction histidine kinase